MMPLGYLVDENASLKQELKTRLSDEWNAFTVSTHEQPVLIEDKGKENRLGMRPSTHLYVVWDDWEPFNPQERSEIIMDAYEETHELPDVVRVTVALGLTTNEARKMGVHYSTQSEGARAA